MKIYHLLLASALVLFSCTEDDFGNGNYQEFVPIELNASTTRIVNNSNKFSMNIFRSMNAEKTGENMVCSPLSISSLLSVILNGADGETAQELNNALGTSGMSLQEVNESYRQLQSDLKNVDKSTKLNLANSVWFNKTNLQSNYVNSIQEYYGAKIQSLDFSKSKSLESINSWCSKNTNGMIPKMLNSLSDQCKMILANTLFFQAEWSDEKCFHESQTAELKFYNADQTVSRVTTLGSSSAMKHYYSDEYKMSTLSLGNGAYEFIIAMPEHGTLEECLDFLDQNGGLEALHELPQIEYPIKIFIPKFEIGYETDMIKHYQALGINSLFDKGSASLPFMANEDLFVSKAEHQVNFIFSEKGIKAAAVSTAEVWGSGALDAPKPQYEPIHYNKPFLFCIMETSTKTVLFLGKIEKL